MFDLLHHDIFRPLRVSGGDIPAAGNNHNVHTLYYNKYFQSEYGLLNSV